MHILRFLFISIATLAAFAGASTPATAGESYDNCVGFIDALPATITTQGTWCLRQDLDTSAGGNMIDIQRSNVTIDCNGFRMRGGDAGISTTAVGIFANSQWNLRIRNCTIRGFSKGIFLFGGGDFIVENNLFDLNRFIAIDIEGAGNVVRRNNVLNTGGAAGGAVAYAIYALGDVTDNLIDGVFGADGVVNFDARGIYSNLAILENFGIVIQGNRIRNLTPKGTGTAIGITSNGQGVLVRDNAMGQPSSTPGTGIVCADNTSHVHDNVILRYATGVASACDKAGGNSIN